MFILSKSPLQENFLFFFIYTNCFMVFLKNTINFLLEKKIQWWSLKKDRVGLPDNSTETSSINWRIPIHAGPYTMELSFNVIQQIKQSFQGEPKKMHQYDKRTRRLYYMLIGAIYKKKNMGKEFEVGKAWRWSWSSKLECHDKGLQSTMSCKVILGNCCNTAINSDD